VIIDGSTDNSIAIAEKYAKVDKRIQVFEKENGGLSDARNYGLERAKGEFIYFMDSDDWIEKNLLEDNIKLLENENLDIVIFGYHQDDEDSQGNVINSTPYYPTVDCMEKGEDNLIDLHMLGLMGYAWNKIYRYSFLKENQLTFEKGISLVEDILFNTQAYQNLNKLRFNSNCYYHYLNRPVSTLIKKYHPDSFELKVKKNEYLEAFFIEWDIRNLNELLADSLFLGVKYCLNNIYSLENGLNNKERFEELSKIADHQRTNIILTNYNPDSVKDKVLLFLMKNRYNRVLRFLKSLS
jgi:glycosyltransferase involved in cell wall biosynthesis